MTTPSDPERIGELEKLRELSERATPGPWFIMEGTGHIVGGLTDKQLADMHAEANEDDDDSDIYDVAHEDWRTKHLPVLENENGIIVTCPRRGDEISEWLSRHPEVTSYAIVDDDADMLLGQSAYFVQTTFETGLLDEHCDRLATILQQVREPA